MNIYECLHIRKKDYKKYANHIRYSFLTLLKCIYFFIYLNKWINKKKIYTNNNKNNNNDTTSTNTTTYNNNNNNNNNDNYAWSRIHLKEKDV